MSPDRDESGGAGFGRGRNLATSLRRKSRARPMDRYDRLPPALRAWLAGAALPWSPHSAARLWTRLLREAGGDVAAALSRLDLAESRMLAKDRCAPGFASGATAGAAGLAETRRFGSPKGKD